MAVDTRVFSAEGYEDDPAYVYAYCDYPHTTTHNWTAITQSVVSSIDYKVSLAGTETDSGTFDKTAVIFDTLQTGNVVSFSFNLRATIPGTAFASPGKHRIAITINLSGGFKCEVWVDHDVLRRM